MGTPRRSFGEEMEQIWQRMVGKHRFLVAMAIFLAFPPLLHLVVYFFPLLLCTGLCVAVFRSMGDEVEKDCASAGTPMASSLERWLTEVCAFPRSGPAPRTNLMPKGSRRNQFPPVAGFSFAVMSEARGSGKAESGYGQKHPENMQGNGSSSQAEAAGAKAQGKAVDPRISSESAQRARGEERFSIWSLGKDLEPDSVWARGNAEFGYRLIREPDVQENDNPSGSQEEADSAGSEAVHSQISAVPAQHGAAGFAFWHQESIVVPSPNRVTSTPESSTSPVYARCARVTAQSRRERARIEKLQAKQDVPREELASPPRVQPDLENLEMLGALVETSPERVFALLGERHRQEGRLRKVRRLKGEQMPQERSQEGKEMQADVERIAQSTRWEEWLASFGPEGKRAQERLDRFANSQAGLDEQAVNGPAISVSSVQQPYRNQASVRRPRCSVSPEDCMSVLEWPKYSSSLEAHAHAQSAKAVCCTRETCGVHEINPASEIPAHDSIMLPTPLLNREEWVEMEGERGTAPRTLDLRMPVAGAGVIAQLPHRGHFTLQARVHNATQDFKGKKRLLVEDSKLNLGVNVGETGQREWGMSSGLEAVTSKDKPNPVPVPPRSTTPADAPLHLCNKPSTIHHGTNNSEVAAVGFSVSEVRGRGRKGMCQLQGLPVQPLPQGDPAKRYLHIKYQTHHWNDLKS